MARNGVEGRRGRRFGERRGRSASGRLCRQIRAFARHQGKGDRACQVPYRLRAGRVSGPAHRWLSGLVDPGGIRPSNGGDVRKGRVGKRRTAIGPDCGLRAPTRWRSTGRVAWPFRPPCGRSPAWRPRSWCTGPSTGSSCGIPHVGAKVQPEESWLLEDDDTDGTNASIGGTKDDPAETEDHDDAPPRSDRLDHAQLLEEHGGRSLHPLPPRTIGIFRRP